MYFHLPFGQSLNGGPAVLWTSVNRYVRASSPCRWNNFNREQKSEWLQKAEAAGTADSLFSCSPDDKEPRGWLCDLINIFGDNGGFEAFHAHLCSGRDALSVTVIAAQIRLVLRRYIR